MDLKHNFICLPPWSQEEHCMNGIVLQHGPSPACHVLVTAERWIQLETKEESIYALQLDFIVKDGKCVKIVSQYLHIFVSL